MGLLTKPFTFTNGTVADALEVNANFDTLFNWSSGNVDGNNISANSIGFSKIDWGTTGDKVDGTETTYWKISKGATNDLSITHTTLTADRTWTHPDFSDTYVGLTGTQTLTNKRLTSPIFDGDVKVYGGGLFQGFSDEGITKTFEADFSAGSLYLASDFSCANNADISGTLNVGSNASIGNNLSVTGTLTGSSISRLIGKVSVGASTAADSALHIFNGSAGTVTALTGTNLTLEASSSSVNYQSFLSPNTATQGILFGDADDNDVGRFLYDHGTNSMSFYTAATSRMTINSSGTVAIAGAATIGTTLGVTGASTLASLGVTGAATVGTTLGVTGATTLTSLSITGAATIGTTLGVTGATTLSSTLGVTGVATFLNEILLPNVDPPTANYANRNGIMKAWLSYTDGTGTVTASYNVDSLGDDDGDGLYDINWDTNFNSGYSTFSVCVNNIDSLAGYAVNTAGLATIALYNVPTASFSDNNFIMMAAGKQ